MALCMTENHHNVIKCLNQLYATLCIIGIWRRFAVDRCVAQFSTSLGSNSCCRSDSDLRRYLRLSEKEGLNSHFLSYDFNSNRL
jgi:hypothetical protein